MAECKNLVVRLMDGGVREKICTTCVHREVCIQTEAGLFSRTNSNLG